MTFLTNIGLFFFMGQLNLAHKGLIGLEIIEAIIYDSREVTVII